MPDPFELIEAEAEGKAKPPEFPDSPTPKPAPSALEKALRGLITPTSKKPADFEGKWIAKGLNGYLDKVNPPPKAKEAEVGQSVALCLDAMGLKIPGANIPIVYLAKSFAAYVQAGKKKEEATP